MRRARTACWVFCLLLSGTVRAATVTFHVDMGPYLAAGYFDPTCDQVELRGDFSGWAEGLHPLQAEIGESTYSAAVDLPTGNIAYKFLIVRCGGAVVWEGEIPNRLWQVPAEGGDVPTVFFDDLATPLDPALRVVGADLSFVPHLQSLGATFGKDGQTAPLLSLVAEAGITLVRLRLWHTPAEPRHGLDATVAFAHQLQDAGFDLMLDLHYSDTWADPGHQAPPSAWQGASTAALADSVTAYTSRVVGRFADEGIALSYLQLGNEINAGLLWDHGRVGWPNGPWDTPEQWSSLTSLLQAAAAGARTALPPGSATELVVHLALGGDNPGCRWFLDELAAAGTDYDVIGLSYYRWWHGSLWDLRTNLRDLGPRYGKPLLVVETAYPWTLEGDDDTANFVTTGADLQAGYPATPSGQRDFLRDVRRVTETSGGLGVVYWEPAFIPVTDGPGNPYENLTLFDFAGDALPGLEFGLAAFPRRCHRAPPAAK